MVFDFQNPHTLYVVASYAVAAVGLLMLALHTVLQARSTRKALEEAEQRK